MPWLLAQAAASAAKEQALTASLSRTKSPAKKPKLSSPPPIYCISFKIANDFGYVFKACQAFKTLNAIGFGNLIDQTGCYDGFDDELFAV